MSTTSASQGRIGTVLAMLLLLSTSTGARSAALATDDYAHAHEELPVRADLSLAQAVSAALARTPAQSLPQARQNEAEALRGRADSWIAGSPALQLRHQNDRWQSRQGLQEWEAGVELPLWRWGQRSALASEAGHARELADAGLALRAWRVAGEVREAYWQTRLDDWMTGWLSAPRSILTPGDSWSRTCCVASRPAMPRQRSVWRPRARAASASCCCTRPKCGISTARCNGVC